MVVESDGLLDESCLGAAPLPQDAVRVWLDTPRVDDMPDLVYLANNRKVAVNLLQQPFPFTAKDAKAIIERAECPDNGAATFAIRMKATGRLIGLARYKSLDAGYSVHVGFWIGEPFWGNGFATEAVHSLVDHAFTQSQTEELTAACRVTNAASRRVLVKSGFQYRDQSMIHSVGAGGTVPIERYSLDKSVWASLKAWGRMQ